MNFFIHIWVFIVTLFVAPAMIAPAPVPQVIEATSTVSIPEATTTPTPTIVTKTFTVPTQNVQHSLDTTATATVQVSIPVVAPVQTTPVVPVDIPQTPQVAQQVAPQVTQPIPQSDPIVMPLISNVQMTLLCRGKLGESMDQFAVVVSLSASANIKFSTSDLNYTSPEADTEHAFNLTIPVNLHDYTVVATSDTDGQTLKGKIPPYASDGSQAFCQ